jgi:RHS repeat-associated protein
MLNEKNLHFIQTKFAAQELRLDPMGMACEKRTVPNDENKQEAGIGQNRQIECLVEGLAVPYRPVFGKQSRITSNADHAAWQLNHNGSLKAGLNIYGYRYYHPQTGRWPSRDPLGELGFIPNEIFLYKYGSVMEKLRGDANLSAYVFSRNSPVSHLDVFGLLEEFEMILNSKATTWITHRVVNPDGSISRTSMKAFSGEGTYRNDPTCCNVKDKGPLPTGKYFIVDRPSGGRLGEVKDWVSGKDEWFALYRDDGTVDDTTTEGGVVRDNIRLHPGSMSFGCVTVDKETFKKIREILLKTQKEKIPGTTTDYYGTITVK